MDGVDKRSPERGRIVITLEYTVPREYWPHYDGTPGDAVDCLRQTVKNHHDGELSILELIDGADSVDIVATK